MTDRTVAVQAVMAEEGFDALLLAAPANMAYVCGFRPRPFERLLALVVPREGPPQLIVPTLEEAAARAAAGPGVELIVWRDVDGPASAVAAALGEAKGGRIGIEKAYLTVARAELVAGSLPGSELDDCGSLIGRLRVVKEESEIHLIRRGALVVDVAVDRLAAELRPGRTEAELASLASTFIREEGGEGLAFEPAVLTGHKSALPHGHPDATHISEGDLVIIDLGAAVGGYCSDITRTFVVGREPDSRQREMFETVRAAQQAAIEAIAPGAPCADVDRAARSVIDEAGLGEYFVHRTGHGLGLEVHEPPYLGGADADVLEEGMVVTVEPGVYVEGYGGVRIEDDVVVRAEGAEVLTRAPIRLELS